MMVPSEGHPCLSQLLHQSFTQNMIMVFAPGAREFSPRSGAARPTVCAPSARYPLNGFSFDLHLQLKVQLLQVFPSQAMTRSCCRS